MLIVYQIFSKPFSLILEVRHLKKCIGIYDRIGRNDECNWIITKIHALFCYYAIKKTKLIGEHMFCMKAHQLSLKSDSTHHFFRNACTKSGSLRFSQFSGC